MLYALLFPDAEVFKDVAKHFVGCDFSSSDFCQMEEAEAKILRYEVARNLVLQALEHSFN